jgi:hypothetical protein
LFKTILNKFHVDVQPTKALVVEYYNSSLHASISMFVKRLGKLTLAENYKEAKNVENKMLSLGGNLRVEDNKSARKKTLLLTKLEKKFLANRFGKCA